MPLAMSPMSYSTLIEIVSILYRFLDMASYLSKVADFNLHHLHLAPPVGVIPGLAILVEHRLVTDTERQTNTGPWHIPQ